MTMAQVGAAAEWLGGDPCPSWCVEDHASEDEFEDRVHASRVFEVPVVVADSPAVAAGRSLRSAEFIVGARRYPGNPDVLVFIGEGDNVATGFDVTIESARRLLVALTQLVTQMTPAGEK